MQVDTLIHFYSVVFFSTMKFISMVFVKEIIFNCVMYAVTVCGTDWKQSLYTIKDSYLVYTNENKESGGIAALVMK